MLWYLTNNVVFVAFIAVICLTAITAQTKCNLARSNQCTSTPTPCKWTFGSCGCSTTDHRKRATVCSFVINNPPKPSFSVNLLSSSLLFTQQAQGRCVCAGDFVPVVNLTSDNDNQSWLVPLLIGIAGCVCLSAVIALIVWQVTSNAAKHNKTALHVTNKYYKACLPCHIDVIHHLFSFGAVLWNRH